MIAALRSWMQRRTASHRPSESRSAETSDAIGEAQRARSRMDAATTARQEEVSLVRLTQMQLRRDIQATSLGGRMVPSPHEGGPR